MSTETKTMPNSKESEMMVLGCMLTNNNSLCTAAESLEEGDFYFKEHKIIFKALKYSHKKEKPADVHLICQELKGQNTLQEVGGLNYIMSLAQYAGTSAYIEEYVERVKNKSLLRNLINVNQLAEKEALDNPDNPQQVIEKLQINIKSIEQRHGKKIPIMKPSDHLENQKLFLDKHRGKDIIGLRTSKIPEFNTHLLGLRGLKLLAAAPNVGKTALTIQIGVDALESAKEACLVYVSLEMTTLAIFNRMTLHLANMDFDTFVLGSQKIQGANEEISFTPEEFRRIERAKEKLHSFGERLQIIDSETCPFLDSRMIINYVEAVKSKTKCTRAIVIIDYLQCWPTSQNTGSEIEADKWRIGEMKKIRDGIQNDPVIVISEARKPSDKSAWGGDLADVMGSARGSYTPDVVMLLNPLTPKQLEAIWKNMKMPEIPNIEMEDSVEDKEGLKIKNFLAHYGIAFCNLQMAKVRDGMQKFNINLAFHFRRNTFEKIQWPEMRILGKDDKK